MLPDARSVSLGCTVRGMRRVLIAACLLLTGCPADPAPARDAGGPPPGMDAGDGRRDAGPMTEDDAGPGRTDAGPPRDCGEVGGMCCETGARCETGATCEDDSCCATPGGGAACGGPDDCCGTDNDCVGGKCCVLQMGSCRTSSDCCSDLLCADGLCLRPFEECGRESQTCCADDECRSGLVCAGGTCEPCGADGEICCKPPSECEGELTCSEGRCEAPDPMCGGDGQPCCAGDACDGTLACTDGTCAEPMVECGYLDCDECTRHYPCGWCDGVGCTTGSSTGPDSGSCGDWAWLASQCMGPADPCADAADCDECTGRGTCGWCGDGSGSCQQGASSGPDAGSCGDWSWLRSECGGSTCATHSDCEACTGEFPCGWCGDTGTCSDGSSTGPDTGSCGDWSWLRSECVGPDPCASETSCGSCAAASGCGWCATDSTCATGDASGPTGGSCADWDFGAAACACSMVQGMCSTDAECCGSLSCRQGVTFGVRCCQEASGSCSGGGDCCGYMDCVSGSCTCRTSGRGCLEDADCCSGTCATGRCT